MERQKAARRRADAHPQIDGQTAQCKSAGPLPRRRTLHQSGRHGGAERLRHHAQSEHGPADRQRRPQESKNDEGDATEGETQEEHAPGGHLVGKPPPRVAPRQGTEAVQPQDSPGAGGGKTERLRQVEHEKRQDHGAAAVDERDEGEKPDLWRQAGEGPTVRGDDAPDQSFLIFIGSLGAEAM